MKFTLTINCDNAAFWEADSESEKTAILHETARILHDAAKHVENGSRSRPLYDINGNRVGLYKFTTK